VTSRGRSALPPGFYERLITKALRRELDALASGGAALVRTGPVDPAEAPGILARHVEALCGHALDALPEQHRKARQTDVVNRVVAMLASDEALRHAVAAEDAVEVPPTELQAVWPITGDPALDRVPPRPTAPLSASDLLVNARGEPALAHALGSEILSADSIDLLCAFVRWHGLRVLEEPLRAHRRVVSRQVVEIRPHHP
jgi:hypothetical protein